jgi:hypothetical protein
MPNSTQRIIEEIAALLPAHVESRQSQAFSAVN